MRLERNNYFVLFFIKLKTNPDFITGEKGLHLLVFLPMNPFCFICTVLHPILNKNVRNEKIVLK